MKFKVTKQTTFNRVAKHLLKQKKRSIGKMFGECAYYGDNGLRCAVGCLISKKHYTSEMEGCSADDSPVESFLKSKGHDIYLCMDLQNIHDYYKPSLWKAKLKKLAKAEGLKCEALNEF